MSRFTEIVRELHHRSVWQVLLIYLGASWAVLEATDHIVGQFELPAWAYGAALILLLIGLPIVVATAFVQEGAPRARGPATGPLGAGESGAPGEAGSSGEGVAPGQADPLTQTAPSAAPPEGVARLFTWRNAVLGGLGAAAIWGVILTTWVVRGVATDSGAAGMTPASADASDRDVAVIPSIAVLPFTDMGSGDDFAFFADGVHEDILTNLSKTKSLLVVSRTSTLKYRDTEQSIREIGDELGADAILEGSVRRFGNDVRITAQLIDAETDTHLWADNFDRKLDNIFALQSEIAVEVASALQATLTPDEERRINAVPTEDLSAYDLYLEGRVLYQNYVQADNEAAIRLFKQAIERDPGYALAWAGLSDAYSQYVNRWEGSREWVDSAVATGRQAVELDPESAPAHKALALAYSQGSRDEDAIASLERALELDPNFSGAANNLGVVLADWGRLDEATPWYSLSARLEPDNPFAHSNLAIAYAYLGLFDESLEAAELSQRSGGLLENDLWGEWHPRYARGERQATDIVDRMVELDPTAMSNLARVAWVHLWAGNLDRAEAYARDALRLHPQADPGYYKTPRMVLGEIALQRGDSEGGEALIRESLERQLTMDPDLLNRWEIHRLAVTYILLGERESALERFEQAQEAGLNVPWVFDQEAAHDPLRGDPRFERTVERARAEQARMRANVEAQLDGRPVA